MKYGREFYSKGAKINFDVNAKVRSDGKTLLHLTESIDIEKYLIKHGAKVTVWEDAVAKQWDAVKQWLDSKPSLIAVTHEGDTLLHHAARHNPDVNFLKYLVSLGADVNVKDCNGNTPLHKAAWHNSNVEVVKYLVSMKADVNSQNIKGKTPLDWARNNTNTTMVKYLESIGAKSGKD